jgi:lysozyme family protein
MSFEAIIERVLGHEGGYVFDPRDPGGATKFGISKRAYPFVDIENLTRTTAISIYRRDYWPRIHGDELPISVAFQVMDAAVNHGAGNAVRWLQRAAGVGDDGIVGPLTLAAVRRMDSRDLVDLFVAERLEFYARLEGFNAFGRGWVRRVAGNLRFAAKDTP